MNGNEKEASLAAMQRLLAEQAAEAWEDSLAMPVEQLEQLALQLGLPLGGKSAVNLMDDPDRLTTELLPAVELLPHEDVRHWAADEPKEQEDLPDRAVQMLAALAPLTLGD